MDLTKISSYVPHGTISYVIYNPFEGDYDEVEAEDFNDLYHSCLEYETDFEIKIIVEDGKTKIVLI